MAKSEFTLRLVSALVLIPVTLAAVWYGGLAFGGLLWLGGIAVAWEWSRIVESQAFGARFWSLAALVTAFVVASGLADAGLALAAIAAGIAVVAGVDLLRRRLNWWSLGAVAGVGLPVLALLVLRGSPMLGLVATIWLMVLVWAGDSAAYVTGRLLGGPRLAPAISPGKTWSGAVGGLVASGVVGLVVAWIIGGTSPVSLALASVGIGAIAQIGDLAESALKRYYSIKDSSNLIPGHGGMMDRVDALSAAAIAAVVLGILRSGAGAPAQGVLIW